MRLGTFDARSRYVWIRTLLKVTPETHISHIQGKERSQAAALMESNAMDHSSLGTTQRIKTTTPVTSCFRQKSLALAHALLVPTIPFIW